MRYWLIALSLLGVALFACSHDEDDHSHTPTGGHTSPYASCQAIIDACHPKDTGEGAAHDCHDVAHAPGASEASCGAKKSDCVTKCNAIVTSVPDAGGATPATDGGS